MKGFMYILKCCDGSYYVGSTNNLERRITEHQTGNGANHTKKYLPVELVYFEEYDRIDEAFYREKQIQKWRRQKKEALINKNPHLLPELARNYTQFPPASAGSASGNSEVKKEPLASTDSADGQLE